MQIHSLSLDDFDEPSYVLLGIHTTLEDYKLAYLLNKQLKTKFKKASYNLDFKNKKNNASFSVFNFEDTISDFNWFLINNSVTNKKKFNQLKLLIDSETKTYLIPEKKKIDYFIKIIGQVNNHFINTTINNINKISQIITSYTVNVATLKSKDYLIF